MKTTLIGKADELKEVLCAVIDAMVATIKADAELRAAGERVPLSSETLQGIERYLRTEHVACSGCGAVKDAGALDLGRCVDCDDSTNVRQ